MDRCVPTSTLLLPLLCSACVCLYTPAPPQPTQISPPNPSDCSLRVEPPQLVVRFGDPVSVNCSYSEEVILGWEGLPVDVEAAFMSFLPWTVQSLRSWSIEPKCYALKEVGQCTVTLPITVYQPPEWVSLSFRNHPGAQQEEPLGPLVEGRVYSLQCEVGAVAPAQNMTVAFYRGHRELGLQNSRTLLKTPVNENFSLEHTVSREDHGAIFYCEVRLELGPEGPQPPPVVRSQNITANVLYAPYSAGSEPQVLTVVQGQSAELDCSSEGNPRPHYSWSVPSDTHTLFSGSVFTIHSASSQHEGVYSCNASNSVGSVQRSFTLTVRVNYVPILVAVVSVGLLLAAIVATVVYFQFYRHRYIGHYNLFHFHRHTPTAK